LRDLLTRNSADDYSAPDETVSDLKIQLLTNQTAKDYAIRLKGKSELLATTNPNTEYTNVIGVKLFQRL
jgi:hypothetical protein